MIAVFSIPILMVSLTDDFLVYHENTGYKILDSLIKVPLIFLCARSCLVRPSSPHESINFTRGPVNNQCQVRYNSFYCSKVPASNLCKPINRIFQSCLDTARSLSPCPSTSLLLDLLIHRTTAVQTRLKPICVPVVQTQVSVSIGFVVDIPTKRRVPE
jgi:hypothetical protein